MNPSKLRAAMLGRSLVRNYIIREATLLDQPELLVMARHFVEQTAYARLFGFNEDAVKHLIVTVLEHGAILVAEFEDPAGPIRPLVGMLALCAFPHPIAGEPYADEVCWWVEPDHRHGLGPALLGAAEEWIRHHGVDLVKMVAPAGSNIGRFYERAGYSALETAYVKRLGHRPADLPVRPSVSGNGQTGA